MKLSFDEGLALRFDERAVALEARLAPPPDNRDDLNEAPETLGGFRSNYVLGGIHREDDEVPRHHVQSDMDYEGFEISRFFRLATPRANGASKFGFYNEHHIEFIALCSAMREQKGARECISLTFVIETVFDWFRFRHGGATHDEDNDPRRTAKDAAMAHSLSATDYLCAQAEVAVQQLEVWVPVTQAVVSAPVPMGKVTLQPITTPLVERWREQWRAFGRLDQPNVELFFDTLFSNIEAATQKTMTARDVTSKPVTAAVVALEAEPIRAVERALEEAERALSVLRYYSFTNYYPSAVCYCTVAGMAFVPSPRHIILQNGMLLAAGRTQSNLRSRWLWPIDDEFLRKVRAVGFDTLCRLLGESEAARTPYQNALLQAIELYGRSSLSHDPRDKLLWIVVALESLLIKGERESLSKKVGERMAFLVGKTLEHRQHIISTYKKAYKLRSEAVHQGVRPDDRLVQRDFMEYAWQTLNRLIERADQHHDKNKMIEAVDAIPYS